MISSGGREGGSAASGVFPNRFTSCSGGGAMGADDSWATTTRAPRNKVAARHTARNIETFTLRIAVCTSGIISIWMRAEGGRQLGPSRGPKSLPQIAVGFRSIDIVSVLASWLLDFAFPAVMVNFSANYSPQPTKLLDSTKNPAYGSPDCGCGGHRRFDAQRKQECLCYFCYNSKVCDGRETSKALLCLGISAGRGISLLHGGRSRPAEGERLCAQPARRPRGSVRHRFARTACKVSSGAGAWPALFQGQQRNRRTRERGPAIRGRICHHL